jgi:hypothetical protein
VLDSLPWTIVAYLVAAASFELVLALQRSTGENDLVWGLAILAMLVGVGIVFRSGRVASLFAPAAAFFVTARFYTGDSYDAPTFRRHADGGIFPPVWIFVLLGLALLAGITTFSWRRTAPVESAVVLLLLAVTALYMGTGH